LPPVQAVAKQQSSLLPQAPPTMLQQVSFLQSLSLPQHSSAATHGSPSGAQLVPPSSPASSPPAPSRAPPPPASPGAPPPASPGAPPPSWHPVAPQPPVAASAPLPPTPELPLEQ